MRILHLLWKGITILPARLIGQGLPATGLWLYEKIVRLGAGVSPAPTSRVTDHLFVGGQHYSHGLRTMGAWGIGATVNLREEADDAQGKVALACHLWLPTPDDGAPTLEQLQEGVAFIRQSIATGQGVYIHCAQGVGRAPTLAAAYLISEGRSSQAALEMIRRVRPFITLTPIQLKRLEEWAQLTTDGGRQTTEPSSVVSRPPSGAS